jgi:metal-responsive CopG/Arc/MetJ family transcriptional regulator
MMVYVGDDLLSEIDEWRRHQEGLPSRSDAVRRVVRRVLNTEKEVAR